MPTLGEWQEISTAPKDGTPILAFWGAGTLCEIAVCRFYRGDWCDVHNEDESYAVPRFWMPLPEGPKECGVSPEISRESENANAFTRPVEPQLRAGEADPRVDPGTVFESEES